MTKEERIALAKVEHDKACSCDPKYLMSCPRMAAAILKTAKPADLLPIVDLHDAVVAEINDRIGVAAADAQPQLVRLYRADLALLESHSSDGGFCRECSGKWEDVLMSDCPVVRNRAKAYGIAVPADE